MVMMVLCFEITEEWQVQIKDVGTVRKRLLRRKQGSRMGILNTNFLRVRMKNAG
jgi:hypothetical protein